MWRALGTGHWQVCISLHVQNFTFYSSATKHLANRLIRLLCAQPFLWNYSSVVLNESRKQKDNS